jgi:16S rRNA (cytosine967-C5)-methyltransferase
MALPAPAPAPGSSASPSVVSAANSVGLAPRRAAWRALQAVAAGAWADAALERELARLPLAPADRALATDLVYGTIRQRRLLDAWLSAHGRLPAQRQPPKLRWLLHLGLYQLLFLERVPASAAVSTTVELAKQGGLGRLASVANGVLRSVLRTRAPLATTDPLAGLLLPSEPLEAFALRHSLPVWIAASLLAWLPVERAEAFVRAANAPPPLDLRVNRLRADRNAVLELLAAAGVAAAPLPDLPDGLSLSCRAGDVTALPGYGEGLWSVQDRSAQRIAPLLEPKPGDRLLDACAAPGGKSTHLAEILGAAGAVWAVDRAGSRLKRLQANALRLGLETIQVLEADATALAEEQPEWRGAFAGILVDAPCSGLGTLCRHPDARWRFEPGALEELTALQDRLLDAMVPLLAPAGRLVYATCSVHPQENGERIAAFLARQPLWQLAFERQWWPGEEGGGDGFYAALLLPPA